MSRNNLTWQYFAVLHEDKRTAFEYLCRALFRREQCDIGTILHSDPNQAGIEVRPVYSKKCGKRISFQAKYFDSRVDYSQIKHSAEKTVEYFKDQIDRIYLYCNYDLSYNRKEFKAVEEFLADANIELIAVTGQTILEQVIDCPQLVSTYFGNMQLTNEWFDNQLSISLDSLGNRYNRKFNIETNITDSFSLFVRSEHCNYINRKKEKTIEGIKRANNGLPYEDRHFADELCDSVASIKDIDCFTLDECLNWKNEYIENNKVRLSQLQDKLDEANVALSALSYDNKDYKAIRAKVFAYSSLAESAEDLSLSVDEQRYVKDNVLFVNGEMGTGKSQLLSTTAVDLRKQKVPCVLLLGQTFLDSAPVEEQIIKALNLDGKYDFESFISVLDELAYEQNRYAVIIIDAINESSNKKIWQDGLIHIIHLLEKYSNIKLVISQRTGFETLTLSDYVSNRINDGSIGLLTHHGFADDSLDAIYDFTSHYEVPFSPDYYLQEEMANPLLLTWFCQTYSGEEKNLQQLIDALIKKADAEASENCGLEPSGALNDLLFEFSDACVTNHNVLKQELLRFQTWDTYGITNKTIYLSAIERFGIFSTFANDGKEYYYFGYNLLENYLRAKQIMNGVHNFENARSACISVLTLRNGMNYLEPDQVNVFAMLSALIAITYDLECIDIVEQVENLSDYDKYDVVKEYLKAIIWRSSHIRLKDFIDIVNKYRVPTKTVWDIFIENATKEQSELNADGLTELLFPYELNRRDCLWTQEINKLTADSRVVSLIYYIEKGNVFTDMPKRKLELLLTLFTWLLASSNRTLRDRTSKAMIEQLKANFHLCLVLLKKFKDINDPYIAQRLYGVVLGASLKRRTESKETYAILADWIYKDIFEKEYVYEDILLRDYARSIIERFIFEYPEEAESIDIIKIRPPYKSHAIPNVETRKYREDLYHAKGAWRLVHSFTFDIPTEKFGMYGDFGRYTFQSALKHFVGVDIENVFYYGLDYIFNTLGYSSDMFGEFDTSRWISSDYPAQANIERIGKKYEWIAMYNILARVSDSHQIQIGGWPNHETEPYSGPWNPYVRDFDPTVNIKSHMINLPKFKADSFPENEFISFESERHAVEDWLLAESLMFSQYPARMIFRDIDEKEWVSLYHHHQEEIYPYGKRADFTGFPRGSQRIWAMATAYILHCNKDVVLKKLLSRDFLQQSYGEVPNIYTIFNREYAWSPACKAYEDETEYYFQQEKPDIQLGRTQSASLNYLWECQADASKEETVAFMIPNFDIIRVLELYQKDADGVYFKGDQIAVFDMILNDAKDHDIVIRRDFLNEYLEKTGSTLFWEVTGEKQFFYGEYEQEWQKRGGYFQYGINGIEGRVEIVPNR